MDRRNFIGSLLRAGAGFAILPAATTYTRIWRPKLIVEPMLFRASDFYGKWSFASLPPPFPPLEDGWQEYYWITGRLPMPKFSEI